MMKTIPITHSDLLQEPTVARMSSTSEDGSAHDSYVWCETCGDEVYIETDAVDVSEHDIAHNSQVTVVITDHSDPQRYVQIRGEFTLVSVADPIDSLHCDTPPYFGHVCPEDMRPHEHGLVGKITPSEVITDQVLDN